jgi:hypothetical protein
MLDHVHTPRFASSNMQNHHRCLPPDRRRFLRNAAGAGALAVALPLAATVAAGSGPERRATRAAVAPRTHGYRVTEHVAAYYRSARA